MIVFKTKGHPSITMLGDHAAKVLEMMGYGHETPSAIGADDVSKALQNLKNSLAHVPLDNAREIDSEDAQREVSLHTRALPIIELLEAAIVGEEPIRWE